MTSATVTQLGEMIASISSNTCSVDTQKGEFAEIFQTAAVKSEGNDMQEMPATKVSVTEKTMSVSKKADELNQPKAEEVVTEPEDVNAVEEELEVAVEELKGEIAEKLDITVEELEAVMETLGLTNASLFTQEGMTALVMEVERVATPVELLTNAEAYQTLQELCNIATQFLDNVQSEFQLTDEQMQTVIADFSKVEEVMQEIPETEQQTQQAQQAQQIQQAETVETETLETVSVQEDSQTEETVVNKAEESLETEETATADEKMAVKETVKFDKSESEAEYKENGQQTGQNNHMVSENSFQQINTQTVNQATDFKPNIAETNLGAQEIYDQIGEYIKTNIKPGISEVEMQLNPENLGTVHIHLSSKQGNVTAQLTVQNELVKAALEIQLIQLKENFAEQGIKVDAVEVTVESHAFNQNMQQGSEENAQAQAEARRTATRSINLNGDWTEEELTEDEQLVAEMMEADGNTVDYKA